ncbi:MAG: ESPR-type extended signal peptide-containing protein, partial [Moraxella sp.]|nr:ESPR-type extended signal peptide-containing protein [Moraxella sp.]
MNHIYKVIFNKATNTFVAVTEFARAQGKTKSIKTAAVATAAVLTASVAQAQLIPTPSTQQPNLVSISSLSTTQQIELVHNIITSNLRIIPTDPKNFGDMYLSTLRDINNGSYAYNPDTKQLVAADTGLPVVFASLPTVNAATAKQNYFHTNDGSKVNAKGGDETTNAADYHETGGATGLNSLAAGINTTATGVAAIAIGTDVQASGESAISIGTGNQVSGNQAGAIGDPSIVAGTASYTFGNDNAIGSTTSNAFILGNNNAIGATATYDANGKLMLPAGLGQEQDNSGSVAIGNYNRITSKNTYVLGSGINTVGTGDNISGLDGTVANSVYLGDDSDARTGSGTVDSNGKGTLNNRAKDKSSAGNTTTGGLGEVTNAKLNGITYGTFAGQKPVGIVTIGASGAERRIQNLAAGEISSTSTDAINGSQLYSVVNNGGWNLQSFGEQKDLVKFGDTVNFTATGETNPIYITTETDGKTTNVGINLLYSEQDFGIGESGLYIKTENLAKGLTPKNYFHVNDTNKTVAPITTNHDAVDGTGGAAGVKALAAGVNAQALGENAIAVGYNATAQTGGANAQQSSNSIAMGTNATVNGQKSVAIGFGANVSADKHNETSGIALGDAATVKGKNSIALGHKAKTEATDQGSAMALGDQAEATNQYAAAIGTTAKAQGYGSTAIAYKAQAMSQNSVALGESATAGKDGGYAEIAIGNRAKATGNRAVAMGLDANSQGASAIAIGQLTKTAEKANQSTAIGYNASTELARSLALGNKANAKGVDSTAIGTTAIANGTSGSAIGTRANSTGTNSFAVGTDAITNAANTLALGTESKANTQFGVAMGYQAQAGEAVDKGYRSTAIGHTAKALANDTIAIGTNAQAKDVTATSIGRNAINAGSGSVAIGDNINISETADRTVVLGREIETLTKSDNVILGSRASEYSATIKNDSYDGNGQIKDKINQATVSGITYGGFAGERAAGVVSIGRDKADHENGDGLDGERRLINVAAGEISERSTDAINGSQLYSVIKNVGFNLQANGDDKSLVKAGDTVQFIDGDNIEITRDGNNITIATARDVDFDSVTAIDAAFENVQVGDDVSINETGLVAGDVSVTTSGINAGNNKITNVAAGTADTDAVNL